MKRLFTQFYLLLFVCFLLMVMLVGLVYKFTAERAGRQSINDLMSSSLYLIRNELRSTPPALWNKTLKKMDLNLSFNLRVEPLKNYPLTIVQKRALLKGKILPLEQQYAFIQHIPRSHYVLYAGPVPYLFYLHEMRLWDLFLLLVIGLTLVIPVLLWIRPHWQDMLKLEKAAQRFGHGHLQERLQLANHSSFTRVAIAFNQMADNINTLIASKKQLIDSIAHELRTPLVRLRYRLAISDHLPAEQSKALHNDLGQLESLIDELLTYARLEHTNQLPVLEHLPLVSWLTEKMATTRSMHPERQFQLEISPKYPADNHYLLDSRLLERVVDNLINNALRYSQQAIRLSLWQDEQGHYLKVEDDGPGIADEDKQRIFEPFVRLDASRDRSTGGCGLGLAIVASIAHTLSGQITVTDSVLGGAAFLFYWPHIDDTATTLPLNSSSSDALALSAPRPTVH